jgi:RNA polymerase sigma factor (sigma-70 family)
MMASDDGISVFESVRPRLFGIAYRMLGSAAEAEDIVQDAWLRWQGTDRSVVVDPPAFLATATTRLAITFAQSARSRRETYIGPWLPEPVDTSANPHLGAERAEALEFAVLLLLEKLSPTERAAYVLREAFDYSYDQIAHILRSTEANSRQLVTRARKHISDGRRKSVSSREQNDCLAPSLWPHRKAIFLLWKNFLHLTLFPMPMAAEDVASFVCTVATRAPLNGAVEIGAPEQFRFDELIRTGLSARKNPRDVVADPHARYFGAELSERSLVPADGAIFGKIRFAEWLASSANPDSNRQSQPATSRCLKKSARIVQSVHRKRSK